MICRSPTAEFSQVAEPNFVTSDWLLGSVNQRSADRARRNPRRKNPTQSTAITNSRVHASVSTATTATTPSGRKARANSFNVTVVPSMTGRRLKPGL